MCVWLFGGKVVHSWPPPEDGLWFINGWTKSHSVPPFIIVSSGIIFSAIHRKIWHLRHYKKLRLLLWFPRMVYFLICILHGSGRDVLIPLCLLLIPSLDWTISYFGKIEMLNWKVYCKNTSIARLITTLTIHLSSHFVPQAIVRKGLKLGMERERKPVSWRIFFYG